MIDEPCGVIVKYHPCTVHARLGSSCPFFVGSRSCGKTFDNCDQSDYDLWYKSVLKSKQGEYYPNRIKLIENANLPLFLYHVGMHAIVGEAEIISFRTKDSKYFYYFNDYIDYSHSVPLELLYIDLRLPKLAKSGRWKSTYIYKDTIKIIRQLAEMDLELRLNLDKNLEKIINELDQVHLKTRYPHWNVVMNTLINKYNKEGVPIVVLNHAKTILEQAKENDLFRGRVVYDLFFASLYLAYRQLGLVKSIDEISVLGNISKKKLASNYRLLINEMKLKVPMVKPHYLIQNRASQLPKKVLNRSYQIATQFSNKNIKLGKAPSSIAAVSVYVASSELKYPITQISISELFNVSTVTIRKLSKEFQKLSQLQYFPYEHTDLDKS